MNFVILNTNQQHSIMVRIAFMFVFFGARAYVWTRWRKYCKNICMHFYVLAYENKYGRKTPVWSTSVATFLMSTSYAHNQMYEYIVHDQKNIWIYCNAYWNKYISLNFCHSTPISYEAEQGKGNYSYWLLRIMYHIIYK